MASPLGELFGGASPNDEVGGTSPLGSIFNGGPTMDRTASSNWRSDYTTPAYAEQAHDANLTPTTPNYVTKGPGGDMSNASGAPMDLGGLNGLLTGGFNLAKGAGQKFQDFQTMLSGGYEKPLDQPQDFGSIGSRVSNALGLGGAVKALGTAGNIVQAPLGLPSLLSGDPNAQRAALGAYKTEGGDTPGIFDVPAVGRALSAGREAQAGALGQIAGDTSQGLGARALAGGAQFALGALPNVAPLPFLPGRATPGGRLASDRATAAKLADAGRFTNDRASAADIAKNALDRQSAADLATSGRLANDRAGAVDLVQPEAAAPTTTVEAPATPVDPFRAQIDAAVARQRANPTPAAELANRFPISTRDTGGGKFAVPLDAEQIAAQRGEVTPAQQAHADNLGIQVADRQAAALSNARDTAIRNRVAELAAQPAESAAPTSLSQQLADSLRAKGRPDLIVGETKPKSDYVASNPRLSTIHDANEAVIAAARSGDLAAAEKAMQAVKDAGGSLDHTRTRLAQAGVEMPTAGEFSQAKARTQLDIARAAGHFPGDEVTAGKVNKGDAMRAWAAKKKAAEGGGNGPVSQGGAGGTGGLGGFLRQETGSTSVRNALGLGLGDFLRGAVRGALGRSGEPPGGGGYKPAPARASGPLSSRLGLTPSGPLASRLAERTTAPIEPPATQRVAAVPRAAAQAKPIRDTGAPGSPERAAALAKRSGDPEYAAKIAAQEAKAAAAAAAQRAGAHNPRLDDGPFSKNAPGMARASVTAARNTLAERMGVNADTGRAPGTTTSGGPRATTAGGPGGGRVSLGNLIRGRLNGRLAEDLITIPKTLTTAISPLHALGRHVAGQAFAHPISYAKGAKSGVLTMADFIKNPKTAETNVQNKIAGMRRDLASQSSPQIMGAEPTGLARLDIRNPHGGAGTGEDFSPSNLPGKLPGIGRLFQGSQNAFSMVKNTTRYEAAKGSVGQYEKLLGRPLTEAEKGGIADTLNHFTGSGFRTDGDIAKAVARAANIPFFSPQLQVSYARMVGDVANAALHPKSIQSLETLRNAAGTVGAIAAWALLAKSAGLGIDTDPQSSNFLKIDVGPQSPANGVASLLASQVGVGAATQSNGHVYIDPTHGMASYIKTLAQTVNDWQTGKRDFAGNPVIGDPLGNQLANRLSPGFYELNQLRLGHQAKPLDVVAPMTVSGPAEAAGWQPPTAQLSSGHLFKGDRPADIQIGPSPAPTTKVGTGTKPAATKRPTPTVKR